MTRQFTITAVVIKEPQMVGDTILINVPVKEGDVLKINGQEVFLPSITPDTEWEKEFNQMRKGTGQFIVPTDAVKQFIHNLLTSRDTYWKERVKKEVEGMPSVFHADNIPDSIQPGDIIPGKPYICRNTLLDKLK